jgi:hypothetical protein
LLENRIRQQAKPDVGYAEVLSAEGLWCHGRNRIRLQVDDLTLLFLCTIWFTRSSTQTFDVRLRSAMWCHELRPSCGGWFVVGVEAMADTMSLRRMIDKVWQK